MMECNDHFIKSILFVNSYTLFLTNRPSVCLKTKDVYRSRSAGRGGGVEGEEIGLVRGWGGGGVNCQKFLELSPSVHGQSPPICPRPE